MPIETLDPRADVSDLGPDGGGAPAPAVPLDEGWRVTRRLGTQSS
jgi:hypothetical protein